jgi:hypothetical protein
MIRITLELVSARDAKRDRLLGIAYLANSGRSTLSFTEDHGTDEPVFNYKLWLSKTIADQQNREWKSGRAAINLDDVALLRSEPDGTVEAFHNVRRGVWDLLYLALRQVVGARNP